MYAVHNRYEQLSVTLGPLKCGVYLNVHLSQTEITLDANFRVLGNRCGTAGPIIDICHMYLKVENK